MATDNSRFNDKVDLRSSAITPGVHHVLDAFGGYGRVWEEVQKRRMDCEIHRLGIDTEARPGCLKGDNRKWLMSLDLSKFDIVDLDATVFLSINSKFCMIVDILDWYFLPSSRFMAEA